MTADRWSEIDRLFHEALARDPDDRDAFLTEACRGDDEMRKEVVSLLRHAGTQAGFLEKPALHEVARNLASAGGVGPASQIEPKLPGYTILRTLGEGGMGVVYLAEQHEPIRRRVALKLIRPGMDSRQVIARFESERQALALMQHPHIAAVFDAGTTADGRPYFVMEHVDGVPITEYCDRQRLPTRARLELFAQVCAGVQHAHQKGVIHRDLKPSNVLVTEEGGRPLPKIIDFGVAKATQASLGDRAAFTEQGLMLGTPEYMSPEQAAMSPDIDTSTDVYSLGVLLYELLVGALPFAASQLRGAGYDEMRRMIRESEPPRPSTRLRTGEAAAAAAAAARQTDTGRLSRQLRGDLDWITLKAIDKDRRQRYPTVAALAADITHYLNDEPIVAHAPSAAYRLRKFVRRYRTAVAGTAAVFVVLLGGLCASTSQYLRAERQRAEADRQRIEATRQREVALDQRLAAERAAREADDQRNAAVLANTEADRQRLLATGEAEAATIARRDAELREYAATIAAADAALRLNYTADARRRLLDVPAERRGWEWHHLLLQSDLSVRTLTAKSPCVRGDGFTVNTTISDNVLTVVGDRILLRRCSTVESWSDPGATNATYTGTGNVLAVGPGNEALMFDEPPPGPPQTFLLRLRDRSTNALISTVGSFRDRPVCAGFSRDGRLAVGFEPKYNVIGEPLEDFFNVYDVQSGALLYRLAPKKPGLFDTRSRPSPSCLAVFSPSGAELATSGATVNIWRADTGAHVLDDGEQAGSVAQPIAWNSNGTRLAIGRLTGLVDVINRDGSVRIERLEGGRFIDLQSMPDSSRRLWVPNRRKNEVLSIAFSSDERWIATARWDMVGLWNVDEKRLTSVLGGHAADVIGVAFDSSGHPLSADSSGAIKTWPAPATLSAGTASVQGSFSPTGELVMSGDGSIVSVAQSDGAIYTWRLADGARIELREGTGTMNIPGIARSMAVSPDGRFVSVGEYDKVGTVRTWDVQTGASTTRAFNARPEPGCESVTPNPQGVPVDKLVALPDGRSMAFRQGRCVVVLDLETMRVQATLRTNPNYVTALPDGALFLTSNVQTPLPGKTRVLIWDWKKDVIRAETTAPATRTTAELSSWRVAASRDGRHLALVGARPAMLLLFDSSLKRELGRLPVTPETGPIAFSPDGTRLATAAGDNTIRIWDVESRQLLLILTDDDRHTGGLAFSRDGRLIAGRSSGGLTIWDSVKR